MEVSDPLIRLSRVTEICGRHYQQSLKDGGKNPERALRLFIDRLVADLKLEPGGPPRVPMRSDE